MEQSNNLLPNYLMTVDGEDSNVNETSFVLSPATGKSFALFAEQSAVQEFKSFTEYSNYQRIVAGVWAMPDTKYYRNTDGFEYTVEFTKESLKESLVKHLKSGKYDKVKLEHTGKALEGFTTIEHWVIEDDSTKSPVLGLSLTDLGYESGSIPKGTVMKSTYVSDIDFWNEYILTGKVKGFSIGGLFDMNLAPRKNVFSAMGLVQHAGKIMTDKGILDIIGDSTTAENGKYVTTTGLSIIVQDNVIVDFGASTDGESQTTVAEDTTVQEDNASLLLSEVLEVAEPLVAAVAAMIPEADNNSSILSEVITEPVDTTEATDGGQAIDGSQVAEDGSIENEVPQLTQEKAEVTTDTPSPELSVVMERMRLMEEQMQSIIQSKAEEVARVANEKDAEIATLKERLLNSPIASSAQRTTPQAKPLTPQGTIKTVMVGGIPTSIKLASKPNN